MTSSIREMSCGHPVTAASLGRQGAMGPCMAAQLPEPVLPLLARLIAASGVVSRPPPDGKHWEEVLSHGPLAHPPPGRTGGKATASGSSGCIPREHWGWHAGLQTHKSLPKHPPGLQQPPGSVLHPGLSPQCPTEMPEPPAEPVMGAPSCPRTTAPPSPYTRVLGSLQGDGRGCRGWLSHAQHPSALPGEPGNDSRWVPAPQTTQRCLSTHSLQQCSRHLWKLLLSR